MSQTTLELPQHDFLTTEVDEKLLRNVRRDLRVAAGGLSIPEVRFLVDQYYGFQDYRIQSNNQATAMQKANEPHYGVSYMLDRLRETEQMIQVMLDSYTRDEPTGMGKWARAVIGIGPVIAAGLLVYTNMEQCVTVGNLWSFAGLNPKQKWLGREKAAQLVADVLRPYPHTKSGIDQDAVMEMADRAARRFEYLNTAGRNEAGNWTVASLSAALAKRPWNARFKVLCVHPESRVTTLRGHVPISEVKVGDFALTHLGRWRRVTKVFVNDHDGPMYGMRSANAGNQVAWLTGGHPVYAAKAETWRSGRTVKVKTTAAFDWHPVEAVKERWMLSRPVVVERAAETFVQRFSLAGVAVGNGYVAAAGKNVAVAHGRAHALPSSVSATPTLMRLLGLYISDGHISGNHIGWSFHENEKHLADFVQAALMDVFDLPSSVSRNAENHCIQVIATAKPLADTLREMIGSNALNHRIPMEWLDLSDELLQALWSGIVDGDGDHVGMVANRRITTANPMLARAYVDLARRLGLSASLHEEGNGACRIHLNSRPDTEVRARSLVAMAYKGPVYNLEVEEDHSYVVEGYAVHNCWKIGESFVKVSTNKNDIYGKVYLARKAGETERNFAGDYADQAVQKLQDYRIGKDTEAHRWYSGGYKPVYTEETGWVAEPCEDGMGVPMLPPGHIHSRAKRYAVKAFLADYWSEYYVRYHDGEKPPLPYPVAHMGHAHTWTGIEWTRTGQG